MPTELEKTFSENGEDGIVAIDDGSDGRNDCDPAAPDFGFTGAKAPAELAVMDCAQPISLSIASACDQSQAVNAGVRRPFF
jgi:hypothetical protein